MLQHILQYISSISTALVIETERKQVCTFDKSYKLFYRNSKIFENIFFSNIN